MIAIGISVLIVIVLLLVYMNSGSGGSPSTTGSDNFHYSTTQKGGVNNPGFLIHTDTDWQGKTESTGCKFENFATLHYGIRAWYVNLFGKVKNGTITNTNQMIDVLTPAGKENAENARNNYKREVAKAQNWLELGIAVFNFEANPDWLNSSQKQQALESGFSSAVQYRYGSGNVPPYFNN